MAPVGARAIGPNSGRFSVQNSGRVWGDRAADFTAFGEGWRGRFVTIDAARFVTIDTRLAQFLGRAPCLRL